jgi:hypothetical protein
MLKTQILFLPGVLKDYLLFLFASGLVVDCLVFWFDLSFDVCFIVLILRL